MQKIVPRNKKNLMEKERRTGFFPRFFAGWVFPNVGRRNGCFFGRDIVNSDEESESSAYFVYIYEIREEALRMVIQGCQSNLWSEFATTQNKIF